MCFKPRKQKDNSSFHSAAAQSDCESAAECRLHGDCNIMSHPGFGHLWKQAELADLDIVISISSGTETEAAGSSAAEELKQQTVLQRLPGHSQIISVSPFFGAQALRWSAKPQQDNASGTVSSDDTAGSSDQQAKRVCRTRQVHITLPDASYDPAAMAVLAGLYQVQTWEQLFESLTHQQQVQAAVLADMWQLPAATSTALRLLTVAIGSAEGLAAVLGQLLAMPAVPHCLQALLEEALLTKFGDLEAVWGADEAGLALEETLLALPRPAMELLASDKLKVASEDTVLFTAQTYVDAQPAGSARQQAAAKLAPLVRCPHLSQFWLSASVLADNAHKRLLGALRSKLKRLLLLKLASSPPAAALSVAAMKGHVRKAPASWLLPPRDLTSTSSAVLEWQLDVAAIKQSAQKCATSHKNTGLTPPTWCLLGGVGWYLQLICKWDASKQCSKIGAYVVAVRPGIPPGAVCPCTFSVECIGLVGPKDDLRACVGRIVRADYDFFGVGPMSGGFDEASWAAKGLPTSGSIVLKLTVQDVGV